MLLSKHFCQFDNQPWQNRGRHFLFGSELLDWILAVQLEREPSEFTRYRIDDPEFVHSQSGISFLLVFQIKRAQGLRQQVGTAVRFREDFDIVRPSEAGHQVARSWQQIYPLYLFKSKPESYGRQFSLCI
jgi:hypothetical protein